MTFDFTITSEGIFISTKNKNTSLKVKKNIVRKEIKESQRAESERERERESRRKKRE